MDTLSFDFLSGLDDVAARARVEFDRREFAQALSTIAGLPGIFRSRADVLEMKARSHEALSEFAEAAAAWEQLLLLAPDHAAARRQVSWCHSKAGADQVFEEPKAHFARSKFAETIASLEAGPPSWRSHPEYHRLKAVSHERLGQFALALASWKDMAAVEPASQEPHVRIPVCQAALGERDAAAAGFRAAADRLPDNMAAQFNWLFHSLGGSPSADAIAAALGEVQRLWARTCNSPDFKSQFDTFKTRLLATFDPVELERCDTEGVLQLGSFAGGAGESLRSAYEQFEPVGNNCEFGSAQRKHGAEPLALFRWTSVTPENLVRLLGDRLEGYEAPERYRLEENREREWILKEDVYQTASHTYLKAPEVEEAALLAKLARRQGFLKRKFLETAAAGRKVFVYKYDQRLEPELVDAVQRGLAALGARKFLFVMRAGPGDVPGTVRIDGADRVTGFLSDFMPNTQFAQWDAIVRQACRHLA